MKIKPIDILPRVYSYTEDLIYRHFHLSMFINKLMHTMKQNQHLYYADAPSFLAAEAMMRHLLSQKEAELV